MGLHRTHQRRMNRAEARQTKADNRVFKDAERARRDARMLAKIKGKGLPFHPAVMSWLSRKLDKPAAKITANDLKAIPAAE